MRGSPPHLRRVLRSFPPRRAEASAIGALAGGASDCVVVRAAALDGTPFNMPEPGLPLKARTPHLLCC